MSLEWKNSISGTGGIALQSKSYTCGYCGNAVASRHGYYATETGLLAMVEVEEKAAASILICPHCQNPTYFDRRGGQVPGQIYGEPVDRISSTEVEALYTEARNCMEVNAYTATILCCRKLLMNIAVAHGAKEGLRFAEYVDYLAANYLLPKGGKDWADLIRTTGNEATHEIAIRERDEAEDLLSFCGVILKLIYEYPAKIDDRLQKAKKKRKQP